MPAVATSGGLPTRLGKYEILSPLAAGGMARIYIARTTGIGSFERHVVLKLITPERANDTIAVQMFLDEARLAASLNHQNVAQVFEVGEDAGIHYLAMEYVHGQDLRALLAKAGSQGTRVPLELALTTVAGAAAGLNHAHERRDGNGVPLGIVHRDVSPSNIMIGLDGSVKLLDFGIAKATARSVETVSGIIKGKFAYMSPEQCRGRDVDRRSDVFSLGIILYEISTQHRCFRADSDFDTMHRIVTGDVVRPTRIVQGYPQPLEAIVMKALAVDANQRYQSAGHLLEAIEAYAVSARMSLSTMALGRFMRELFGETPEPWMMAGRSNPAITPPKESTISNTNGSGDPRSSAQMHTLTPQPSGLAPQNMAAARTLLDLPPERHEDREEAGDVNAAEWNAKSYPPMPPAYASTQTLPPNVTLQPVPPAAMASLRSSAANLPAAATATAVPAPLPMGSQPQIDVRPAGTQPPPNAQWAPAPGSGSHSAPRPIPSTRSGYAGGAGQSQALSQQSEISYPRYEPPDDSAADLRLRPNRRPLLIGAIILLVAGGIVLYIATRVPNVNAPDSLHEQPPVPEPTQVEDHATPPPTPPPPTPTPTADQKAPVVVPASIDAGTEDAPEESISIKVVSIPSQANVLLNGKPIGTTPLDTKIPKNNTSATLVVQRAGYEEVHTKIDLTGDFSKEVTLVKLPDRPDTKDGKADGKPDKKPDKIDKKPDKKPGIGAPPDKKPAFTVAKPDKKPDAPKPPDKKPEAKPACQPPGQVDPFDSRPVCK